MSEPGNASRNFDRKLRSTLRALCAGDPDIRRTRARHICPNVSVRESSSFEIVNSKVSEIFVDYIHAFFCADNRRSKKQIVEKTSLNLPRRGTTLTLTLVHETHHATTEENSFRNRIVAIVYSDISSSCLE